jgi:dTMP kinase
MPTPSSPSRAVFIALEGIDGSGTTTQLGHLTAHLEARGRRAYATREPSVGPVGRLLRELLVGQHPLPGGAPADGQAMALLFAADRRDHLRREIEPELARGVDVVSDRYLMSSLAYQAEEADRTWVAELARAVRPTDLTILLDVPAPVAAARRYAAGRVVERYDGDDLQAHVAENYKRLAAADPGAVVIDGRGSVAEVGAAVVDAVDELLARIARIARID